MMKTCTVVRARCVCLNLCLAVALVGCGGGSSGSSFDGEHAPYGPKTATTRLHSTVTVSNPLLPNISVAQDTAVVGQKTIGGVAYDRLATTRSDDPSKGGEYWIKENADGTLDFAGYLNSDLLGGVVPGASTTFDKPIKVNLNPPIGQPQSLAASGTVALAGAAAPSPATFNGQYTLLEKEATAATGLGPVSGCNHYQGNATSTSPEIPTALKGAAPTADLWYHPSYGVVAFNAPTLGVGTSMTGTDDCGSVDASDYRIIRKMGVVDASTSFDLDTYICDGNQFAADKNTHASMLLELRWVDETTAMGDVQPAPVVEFGTGWGTFPQAMNEMPASVFHPEESSKGFKYWYSYVNQAAKNEPGDNSTSYHIKVTGVAGLAPVRVTARIYYKVLPDHLGSAADGGTAGGKRDGGSGVDSAPSDGPSSAYGTIVLDPVAAGDRANWTPPAVNSNPTMTFDEIVSPYDSGVALRTTASGTTLMACPVEYTSRDFQLPGSISSAAYALQLYLALDSDMTTYNWPGLQVDLLSGGAVVADIEYYRAAATGTYIMQRTASWHAITDNGFQTLALSPLLDSSGVVIPTPVTFDKIRITMVNYTCVGTNSVIIDQLSLVPTGSSAGGGNRDGGVDGAVTTGAAKDSSIADAVAGKADGGADGLGAGTACNLIVNGNAESAVGSVDGTPVVTPGWTADGEATAGQYGAPYGYPGPTDPGPDDRGSNLFAGGVADAISTLTQTVSVSQYASTIDAGGVSYLLSGWLGGWDGQDDNATLTATFQNASGSALGSGTIGPVLSSDRSGVSGLLFRSTSGLVPSGTRAVLVVVTFARASGSNNDAYADNLSFSLSGAGLPATACNPGQVVDGGVVGDAGRDAPAVTGDGGGLAIPPGTPTITEEFDTLPTTTTQFVPIQAAGGDFTTFATVSGGELVVNVPAGNNWGKTGVRSKDPVFQVTDDMATNPWSVLVELDSAATTGLAVVLSPTAYDDIYTSANFWWAWVRHPIAGGTSTNIVNTQDTTDTAKSLTNTPLTAPGTMAVVSRPGQIQACTSGGWGMEGSYAWMKTGTKVYAYVFSHAYDAGMPVKLAVKSIKVVRGAACGAAGTTPPYTAAPESAVFSDDLSTVSTANWTPIQAAGGDYSKFASTPAGELYVNVPAGNNWGKTGLRSNYFMFDVRDDMATTPLSLSFDFVPARTSGFALVLSATAYDDIWTSENFWGAFVRHPTGAGATANIVNTQNTSDSSMSLPNIPSDAPSTVTLSVRPGHAQMCTSTGWGMEGDYAWMKTGAKVYAYAFSHAYDSGMPVQMDLTGVRANRAATCGASGATTAYPAPAPRVLFTDSFAGGYAQNWVGIQAAGGNFASFAVNATNEVYVNVPAGNSWGKTGIRSNYYLFDVRSDYATSPMTLDFAIDPTRTTGFVIALSTTAYDDIWTSQNVWLAFIIDPDTGLAELDLTNTQSTTDTTISKTALSAAVPSKASLTITPNHVKATLSNGQVLEGDYAWLTAGAKVYAYAFSHPIREGLASSLALKSITATR